MKGLWLLDGSQKKQFEIIQNNNVTLYGSRQSDHSFFMYNDASLVEKTMSFWLNRSSHIWRMLCVEQSLFDGLDPEAGDYCDVDYSVIDPLDIADNVSGQVIGLSYDTLTHKVSYTLWTPVAYGFGDLSASDAWLDDSADSLPTDPILGRTLVNYTPIVYIELTAAELSRDTEDAPEPAYSYIYFAYVTSISGDKLTVNLYDEAGDQYVTGDYSGVDVTVLSTGSTNIDYNVPYIKAGMDVQIALLNNKYYFTGGLISSVYRG
jgi:hypothetical protein